jgi:hypothetical protein
VEMANAIIRLGNFVVHVLRIVDLVVCLYFFVGLSCGNTFTKKPEKKKMDRELRLTQTRVKSQKCVKS